MRDVTLTRTIRDTQGNQVVVSKTIQVGYRIRIGMDGQQGTEWNAHLANYPNVLYTRDFGKDNLYGTDADTATEWTKWGTGKWLGTNAPTNMMVHLSCKDDPLETLGAWFDTIPSNVPPTHPGVYLSNFHEPVEEVRDGIITTAQLRQQGKAITDFVRAHPKGWIVKGVGPILTRFDLDEGVGGVPSNPADYGWDGMDFFGVDCYQSNTGAAAYYDTYKMFGKVFDRIHSVFPNIPLMVPEYGMVKLTNDPTGEKRALALRQHLTYLRNRGDVLAVAYFNSTGSIPAVPFAANSPEADVWREFQANQ